jgi:hypothetical protein
MDWFKGKSSPETMGFLPSNIGFSGSNFPIIKNSVSWWFQPSHLEKKKWMMIPNVRMTNND